MLSSNGNIFHKRRVLILKALPKANGDTKMIPLNTYERFNPLESVENCIPTSLLIMLFYIVEILEETLFSTCSNGSTISVVDEMISTCSNGSTFGVVDEMSTHVFLKHA